MDSSKSINSNSSDFSTSIGDFKLEKEIGEGAFSKVMLATNEISSKE